MSGMGGKRTSKCQQTPVSSKAGVSRLSTPRSPDFGLTHHLQELVAVRVSCFDRVKHRRKDVGFAVALHALDASPLRNTLHGSENLLTFEEITFAVEVCDPDE